MDNWKHKAASGFKRYLPTLRSSDRIALGVFLGIGLLFILISALPNALTFPPVLPFVDQVNINIADLDTLQLLPGVGPVLAQRIVDDRQENGPYQSASDLQRVNGIGPKTVEKLLSLLRFFPSEEAK